MSHNTFLIVCVILIAIPFVVSCIKGNPMIGLIVGFASFLIMGFVAGQGGSMFEVHAVGFVIAGLGTAWAINDGRAP